MLPSSKELLQNTWLGKKHPRNERLLCDWSPEHTQTRSSYLGFSLERCCLARSKSISLPRVTSPFIKISDVLTRAHQLRDLDGCSYCDGAIITHLVWHLHQHPPPAPAPGGAALALSHIPSSRRHWDLTHRGGFSPALSLQTQPQLAQSQSGSDGLMNPPNTKPSLCCLQVSSFHQPDTSSTSNRAQAQQETPGPDRGELKPVAKQSCSAWFWLKVLFYFILKWSGTRSVAFYPLSEDGANHTHWGAKPPSSALIQKDDRREGGGKRPKSEKCDVSDLEHRLLLWKCWWNQEFSYEILKLYVPSRYFHLGE